MPQLPLVKPAKDRYGRQNVTTVDSLNVLDFLGRYEGNFGATTNPFPEYGVLTYKSSFRVHRAFGCGAYQ